VACTGIPWYPRTVLPISRSDDMTRAAAGVFCIGLLALPFGLVSQAQPAAKPPKPAEQRDAFFKSGKVVQLQIELGKKELESLRADARKYVKATLTEGDTSYADAGIHLKGAAGSFQGIDDKPGLTLNMDKFKADQLYRGMDKFHLANSVQDPSYL